MPFRYYFWEDYWKIGIIDKPIEHFLTDDSFFNEIKIIETPESFYLADPFWHEGLKPNSFLCEKFSFHNQLGSIVEVEISEKNILSVNEKIKGTGHFSFPSIIRHENSIFISPENSDSGKLFMYDLNDSGNCIELLNIPAVDPLIYKNNDTYFLFCSIFGESENEKIQLFFSNELTKGWQKHPLSPISNSNLGGRMAGNIIQVGDKKYRLGQNFNKEYGSGISVFEIEKISTTEYKENFVRRIECPFGYIGLHTLNKFGDKTLVDIKSKRLSLLKPINRFRRKLSHPQEPFKNLQLELKTSMLRTTNTSLQADLSKPYFSVIIPTYNRAYCILTAIHSILKQDFIHFELIIVDDGSTDNTKEVVGTITDQRVNYFYKDNEERGAARNFGVKQAKGEYLFFLDSDDLIKPGYLTSAFNLIKKTNADCLHLPYSFIYNSKEKNGPIWIGSVKNKLRRQNRLACQIIIKKACAQEFQFCENRNFIIGEDWYLILMLMSKYNFVIGKERLGIIVQHDLRSMINTPYEQVLTSKTIFLEELKKNLPDDLKLRNNVDYELTNFAALHAAIQKEKKTAIKLLLTSIRMKPFRLFRPRNFVILKKILTN